MDEWRDTGASGQTTAATVAGPAACKCKCRSRTEPPLAFKPPKRLEETCPGSTSDSGASMTKWLPPELNAWSGFEKLRGCQSFCGKARGRKPSAVYQHAHAKLAVWLREEKRPVSWKWDAEIQICHRSKKPTPRHMLNICSRREPRNQDSPQHASN